MDHLWRTAWARPDGRWPFLRWGLGLLVPAALVLWGMSLLLAPEEPELLRISVESQSTGETIEGASVVVGGVRYVTDASGAITIDPVPAGTEVLVSAAGHESARSETTGDAATPMRISLSAVLVLGSVADIVSGAAVDGATLTVVDANGGEVASTRTDESGSFVFKFIPEDAEIVVTHDIYGEHRRPLGEDRSLFIQLDPPPVRGTIVDADGEPIAGASIRGARAEVVSDDDGTFTIEGVGQGEVLAVAMEGMEPSTVTVAGIELGLIRLPDPDASPVSTPTLAEGEG